LPSTEDFFAPLLSGQNDAITASIAAAPQSSGADDSFSAELTSLSLPDPQLLRLAINHTTDQAIAANGTSVGFTVSGFNPNETTTNTFADADNHHLTMDVNPGGNDTPNLTSLDDGTITPSLVETGQGGQTTSGAGNPIAVDTERNLTPTITVNAANPADVTFTVDGLQADEHGSVTFADTSGRQDTVPIASNGTYSANLSNLAIGTITYTMSVTDPAGNVTTVDPTATLGDGSANAPAGPAQLPNLLAGEAVRPPWMVAGVDYAVGIPAGTVLTDWQNLTGPGISIVGNTVRIDNTNNVHISNVDFSLHGGANLYITNSNNTVVTDCNFQSTTSAEIIQLAGSSSGLTVSYCNIDGDSAAADGNALIGATGNVVVQYDWLKNFPERAVALWGGDTSLNLSYNLIENGAMYPGAHLNFLQLSGANATISAVVEFNTTYQQVQASSGEGFQFYDNETGGTLVSPTLANNTMIASPTQGASYLSGGNNIAMSYLLHGSSGSQYPTAITGTASIYDNYFDATSAYGIFYPNSFNGWSIYNNIDMTNGNTIGSGSPPNTAPAAPTIGSFSPDTGSVAGITDASVLTLTGTAAANSTVNVYDGSTLLGTTATNTSGAWSYTTATLTDGTHNFTATDTQSGATSTASAALAVTVDSVVPVAPVISSAAIVNSNEASLNGTALDQGVVEAGDVIKIYDGSILLGSTTTNAAGGWSLTSGPLAPGTHALTSTVTDEAGNISAASQAIDLTVASAPAAPSIGSFSPVTGSVTGATDASVLTLTGTAAANSTVNVYDGSTLLGTTAANTNGAWSYTTATLANGVHSFTATDALSGATSTASTALAVTIDLVAPAAPVISSAAVVNSNEASLNGTALDQGVAEIGDVVKIYDGSTLLGSTTTNAAGGWTYTSGPLASGTHALTATVTDEAGNISAASQAVDLTVASAFVSPTIGSFLPDTGSIAGVTDANVLTLTGAAAASSTVNLYDGTVLLGTATTDATGAWTFKTATLTDGIHSFTATDTLSGATSAASAALAVTVDTVAPAAPIITSDATHSDNTVSISGTALDHGAAEPGDLVKIYDGSTLIGTTTTDPSGSWSYTTNPLSDGYHPLTATVTDVAGNTSAPSQVVDPLVDPPVSPTAPAITSFSPATGSVAEVTDANVVTLSGKAEANTTVSVHDGSTLLGTSTANASGAWTYVTPKLADGTHAFNATDIDASGLTSGASSTLNVTIDTVAPTDTFTGAVKNSNGSFTLTGTALDQGVPESGDVVKIYDNTSYLGSATVGSNGSWNFTTPALVDSVHTFTSTVTDQAGNIGQSSSSVTFNTSTKHIYVSTTGNDVMTGAGGSDTFVFTGTNFGKDVITNFHPQGGNQDVIQFSQTAFSNFAAVLSHAQQVGSDVVITHDTADTVTLKNVVLNKLTQSNFLFV
jgi:hypothetical protein